MIHAPYGIIFGNTPPFLPLFIRCSLLFLINTYNSHKSIEEANHLSSLRTICILIIRILTWDVRWNPVPTACHIYHKIIPPNPVHISIDTKVVILSLIRMLSLNIVCNLLISFYHSMQSLPNHTCLHVSHNIPTSWHNVSLMVVHLITQPNMVNFTHHNFLTYFLHPRINNDPPYQLRPWLTLSIMRSYCLISTLIKLNILGGLVCVVNYYLNFLIKLVTQIITTLSSLLGNEIVVYVLTLLSVATV